MTNRYEFSENIQRGILYLSKSDREFFVQTSHMIRPEYFDTDIQGALYSVVVDYFEKYRKLPSDALIIEGLKEKKLEGEVEENFKQEIYRINAIQKESLSHKEAYLDMAEKFAKERAMKEAIIRSIDLLQDNSNIEAIEEEVKKALKVGRHADTGLSYKCNAEDRYSRFYGIQAEKDRFGIGFPSLDNPLHGGLCRKELGMIVANSGVGKSLFLCRQALETAMAGQNVLYITLEMSEDSIMARLDTMITRLDYQTIRDNRNEFIDRLTRVSPLIRGEITVKQFPSLLTTVNKIRAFLEYCQNYKEIKYDMLILDYLELARPSVKDLPEYEAQQRIAQELRGLAVEYDLVVWSATQSNRCIFSETEIYTKVNGEIYTKPLSKFEVGDFVLTNKGPKKVTKVYPEIEQECYEITLQSGRKVICSMEHEFPMYDDTNKSISTGLKEGDYLLCENDDNLQTNNKSQTY